MAVQKLDLVLSEKQIDQLYLYATQIIENLPPKAMNELLDGYNYDQVALLNEMFVQINNVVNFGHTLETEKLSYLDSLEESMDRTLKKLSFNYFIATCLPNFTLGWRNLEWGNMVQLFPWSAYLCQRGSGKSFHFCVGFPLWRLYSYDKPLPFTKDTRDNHNRLETIIVTNESSLGKVHLAKIVDEIKNNDILAEKLNPTGKANLGIEAVKTETGSLVDLRTLYGSGLRGRHSGAVLADDLISESSLYSKEQRSKAKEIFYGSMANIVEPGGYFVVSGTPYVYGDIYTDLKNDPKFKVFEYPGIMPYHENGKLAYRLLAPDRFTYKHLLDLRTSLGSMVFSREILVTPVSDSSSIFPYEILMKSTIGMENVSLVTNINSFPFKLVKVVCGVDFAISANIGADYTVMVVYGMDSNENIYLLHLYRKQGATHNEQINQIVAIDRNFKCNSIVCESNGFQAILSSLARERGLRNIKEFTTMSGNKKNLREGWPSLAAMFERGQIRIPYQSGETKEIVDNLFSEFNSVSFNPDNSKLESVSEHDDMVSSSFMAINELRENSVKFRFHQV